MCNVLGRERRLNYGCNFEIVEDIDKAKLSQLIECDLTIPQISEQFSEYTYDQIYDTIYCDRELNPLYRKHGQLKVKKKV